MTKVADWSPIEKQYRETKTSVAHIAKAFGISIPTLHNHMKKYGITRNPVDAVAITNNEDKPVKEVTSKELKALRDAVVSTHRDAVKLDHKRLDIISERLDATTGLSNMQRLTALKMIVSIRETIIKLERQAHNIIEEAPPPPPPAAIQVNVNIAPQAAYMELLGQK